MTITYEDQAIRNQVWFRGFLMGPNGSGKSRGSFELASRIFGGGLDIALINTEENRGHLYADRFKYALAEIFGDYHPHRFIETLDWAEGKVPGGVVIVDSVTHEWYGTNGVNQQASRFNDWAKARPLHQEFVDRIASVQCHVIVCCRAKMKYDVSEVDDNGRKKQVISMLGVGPMQDQDFQYEFNLTGRFEQKSHEVEWSGHIDSLQGQVTTLVDADADLVAERVTAWCSEGEPPAAPEEATEDAVAALVVSLHAEDIADETIEEKFVSAKHQNRGVLHPDWVRKNYEASQKRLAKKHGSEATGEQAEREPAAV